MIRDHINALEPDSARCVFGHTPEKERKLVMEDHRRGEYPYLLNVDCLTEGYDDRSVKCVVMARPTASRARHAQATGRGMRPLKGTIDHLSHEPAIARREAILASDKPYLDVYDFYGNSGRHSLMTPVKVLAGDDYSPAAIELAEEKLKEDESLDLIETLEEAEKEVEIVYQKQQSRLADMVARGEIEFVVNSKREIIDPFFVWPLPRSEIYMDAMRGRLPSKEQVQKLKKYGIKHDHLNFEQAKTVLNNLDKELKKPTAKQKKILAMGGVPNYDRVTRKEAGLLFSIRKNNRWRPWNSWKHQVPSQLRQKLEA